MGIKVIKILLFLNMLASLSACYKNNNLQSTNSTVGNDSVQISDALTFYQTHHYGIGYNFIVKTDSLLLISQQPEEYVSQLVTDTFVVKHNQQVAVSDIRIIPQDSIDSVWVQIITDNGNIGWNHESEMLSKVMPTDPISQFIMFFSDTHFIIALIILTIIIAAYLEVKGDMWKDTDYFVNRNGSLYGVDGSLYIELIDPTESLNALNEASKDETSNVYSEGDTQKDEISKFNSYRVTDEFYMFLAHLDSMLI